MPWWERRMLLEGLNAEAEEADEGEGHTPAPAASDPASSDDLAGMGFDVREA